MLNFQGIIFCISQHLTQPPQIWSILSRNPSHNAQPLIGRISSVSDKTKSSPHTAPFVPTRLFKATIPDQLQFFPPGGHFGDEWCSNWSFLRLSFISTWTSVQKLAKLHKKKLVNTVNSKGNLDSLARNYLTIHIKSDMCFSKDCHAIPPNHPKSFLPLDTMYSTCTLSKRSPWAKAPHSKACDTSAMQALCASTSSPWCWDVWIGQHAARP